MKVGAIAWVILFIIASCAEEVDNPASILPTNCDWCSFDGTLDGVSGFDARFSGNEIALSWTLPNAPGIAGVMIRHSTISSPGTPFDGELIYEGLGNTFIHEDVEGELPQYYSVFTYDSSSHFSLGEFDTVNHWESRSLMPTARRDLSSCELNGNILSMGGGKSINGEVTHTSVLGTVESYNPTTESWSALDQMSTARFSFSCSVVRGILYAIGGVTSPRSVEAFGASAWSTISPMSYSRSGSTSSAVNDTIYVFGGYDYNAADYVSIVEAYQLGLNRWTTMTSIPSTSGGMFSSVVDGIIYLVSASTGVQSYNPHSGNWVLRASFPTSGTVIASVAVNGTIFVISRNGDTNEMHAFNPVDDTWSSRAPLPSARSRLSAVAVDESIYVIGGYHYLEEREVAIVESYTP